MTGEVFPLSGRRVLVVEDDYYLAADEQAALERAGAKVVGPFPSHKAALDAADPAQIDCAVVDINVGRGPSFDFAAALQEKGIPFVFVTGYDADSIPETFSQVPRIAKPIRERDLIAALKRLGQAAART